MGEERAPSDDATSGGTAKMQLAGILNRRRQEGKDTEGREEAAGECLVGEEEADVMRVRRPAPTIIPVGEGTTGADRSWPQPHPPLRPACPLRQQRCG